MNYSGLTFSNEQFDRLFPFYILLDESMQIISCGRTLEKLCPDITGNFFSEIFSVKRPAPETTEFESLKDICNQLVVLEVHNEDKTVLRGQFEYFIESHQLLFIGSPWFDSMEKVKHTNLNINDFAYHDPLIDLLHVLKTQEITNNDLKELLRTVSKQKTALKKAADEVKDIALFPMQNPDPLVRITTDGTVIMMNPAAAGLDSFIYKNKYYKSEFFWKEIVKEIDANENSWAFEAASGENIFSFICLFITEQRYYNVYGRNVTAQKKTDAALTNRVNQFQSLSENIPGVIYEFEFKADGSEGLRYISPAIEKIFGIKPGEFKNYLSYIHPDDRERIIQKNHRSREALESFYDESRLIIPGQPLRWHSVHSSFSYKTENGDNIFTGFMLDITERKNAEEKLEQQRLFYEDILNNMPADIAVFNHKHEYLFVNPRGIKDEALRKWIVGKRDEDYCTYRNKPQSIAAGRRAIFNKVVESKMPNEWEEKNIKPDGSEEYVLRRWFPVLDDNSNVSLVIGYGIDITERKKFEQALKENEEKYRNIIANMNLGLMEMDPERKISFANQMLLNMTGLSKSEVIGYNASLFLSEQSLEEVKERMKNRPKGISEAYEVQVDTGKEKGWWFVSSAPRFSTGGEHTGSIVICLDITNQKKLQAELIESREQAEQLAKAKEIFLANMSHEIRTPMNAIIGMGNQLAKTGLSSQQQFYLDTIKTAADNLLVIINDILDLSKIEAGKLSIEKIGFEPKKVVADAMQVLMHKAEEKGLSLTNSYCDSKLSSVLIGDPYRLNQVLLNLISNAIKFTEKGSVDVSCKVLHETATTQTVQAKITDTGIGMDKDFAEKLFDKFSQEYESVSRRFGGTGLGMSICKELIELMGGTIEVNSAKGKGTTVTFRIEFDKGTGADLPVNISASITGNFLQDKTILVADDNDMNFFVAAAILESHGASVIKASDGNEALAAVGNNAIDLVLMDIQMPVLNGYEAAKAIRKLGITVPVIALTANAIKGETEKCIEAGMNDYIAKPFREEEFLKKIAYWLKTEIMIHDERNATPAGNNAAQLYSLSSLVQISRGNNAFVEKMVKLFCEQTPLFVQQMRDAYNTGDLKTMGDIAHKIKPGIDNLAINSLKEPIRKIEKAGRENFHEPDLPMLLALVADTIVVVVDDMRK